MSAEPASVPPPRWPLALGLLALLGLVAALYGDTLGYPFQYDDRAEILLNPIVHRLFAWGPLFRYNPFRVLLLATFSWDYHQWGANPAGYRLVNLVIHAVNGGLLWALAYRLLGHGPDTPTVSAQGTRAARRLRLQASGLAAAVFLAHPLAIEAVTYISGRSSSLSTTVVLGAMLCWHQAEQAARDERLSMDASRGLVERLALGASALAVVTVLAAAALQLGWVDSISAPVVGVVGLLLLVGPFLLGRPALSPPPTAVLLWSTASFGLFGVALVVKEIAATLPAFLALHSAWLLHRETRPGWRARIRYAWGRTALFFCIPALLAAARVWLYGSVVGERALRPPLVNLRTQLEVIARYLGLLVGVGEHSIFHDHAAAWSFQPLTWAGLGLILTLLLVGLWQSRKRPVLALGLVWFLIALTPTSSIFPLKETMAEHRMYYPGVGLALALGAALVAAGRRWPLLARPFGMVLIGALLLGPASLGTRRYNAAWATTDGLWERAVELNPCASGAWRNLGDLARERRELRLAEERYRQALECRPLEPATHKMLGLVVAMQSPDRYNEALFHLHRALQERPCYSGALVNIGVIFRQRGELDEAVVRFEDALSCPADSFHSHFNAHYNLATIYDGLGDRTQAVRHYNACVEIDPAHPYAQVIKRRLQDLTW